MQDCKRMPFDPDPQDKFYIAEITGMKMEKNETRLYKVRWEQSWIPATRLRAWQDLIIHFWEGYHSNGDSKVMELNTGCDQPPVYVLSSDCESRDDLQQAVASSDSDKHHAVMETEQHDITSSVNFDTFTEGDYSDTERGDDMNLDSDKISIFPHKHLRPARQKRLSSGLPYSKDELLNEHILRPDLHPDRDSIVSVKEEITYGAYHRNDIIQHEPFQSRVFLPHDNNTGNGSVGGGVGDPYNYRVSISPKSTRETHEFQPVQPMQRSSLSPQEPMSPYETKKAYYCYLCGKEYRSGTGLKQHLLAHKNEKPFGCNLCHRRYRWKGDLNRHMYTHLPNNELPLKCPECQKGFVRKDKMQLHINFAHGGGGRGGGGCSGGGGGGGGERGCSVSNAGEHDEDDNNNKDNIPSSSSFSSPPGIADDQDKEAATSPPLV